MSRVTGAYIPSPARGRSPGRARTGWRSAAAMAWLPVLLLVAWWFASENSTSPFFPPLSAIVEETWNQWIRYGAWVNAVTSLRNLFLGYLAGTLVGIVAGSLMWRWRAVRTASNPIIYFLYVLPSPALLPAMIALFGIGDVRQIALITLGSIWPTLLNTLDGMRGVDAVKFDTARALRLGGWRSYFQLVLPGASPQIVAGLRASLTVAIILMVVSEMVAARSGIGYFILQAQAEFAILKMWTGILVLALIGTLLNYLFVAIERRVLRWHYRSRALAS
ncbi:ABC transporter permease [Citricoccus sp. SGAir0253]|uniref:ABC transporter permease n=1 Tax=Citricoccus sp. SGAir0253 TaxID=2567881 RepID=UPI0010CD2FB2|nr:ABC transporter permease [Citricoccus sp. SGAir0253]QCU77566.1 ABC transporter permease [Citricoccus sp. SGAir0253]